MSEPAPNAAPEEKVPMPLSNENSTTDPTPQQNQDVTTTQNNSGALSMFAQPTSCDVNDGTNDAGNMNIDLDDLFHDCYFGDFPIPILADQTPSAAIPEQTPNPLPASMPAQTIVSPSIPQQQNTNPPQKRKAAQAIEPTPVSVLSSTPTYIPSPTTTATSNTRTTKSMTAPTTNKPATVYSYPGFSSGTQSSSGNTTRQLTDQQKTERRNRNREHAKRSRLRKKFLLESLQEQIHGLQSEIEDLKTVIKKELPDKAEKILEGINGKQGQFTPLPMPSGFGPVKTLMEPDFRLMSALSGSQQNFAISDPSLPDNPIVYVSQGFLDLTGYTLEQVLGRNCRFLQGPGTDQSAVDVIRKGVREGVDTSVCLLNYKADGTPFWNQFFVAALRDAENNVVNFVGVQCEVSKAVVESQISDRQNTSQPKV